MKWRAVQLKVMYLLVSILVFGSLNTKVASVLTKSIFFSLKLLLLGGPDGGPDGGSNGGPNGGSRFCTRPPVSTLAICEFTRETNV